MTYVDGFVLIVPKNRVDEYRKMAREGRKAWIKHGALDYKETILDDPRPVPISFTFPKMAKARKGDTVWFSYIVYKSRKHRDRVNAAVWKEMSKKYPDSKKMPFDADRMAFGGFKVVVE